VVEDLGTVIQLYQLDGKNKSMRDAEALGVAVQLMNYATSYSPPERTYRFGGGAIAEDAMIS
jgi:hypothetical protein